MKSRNLEVYIDHAQAILHRYKKANINGQYDFKIKKIGQDIKQAQRQLKILQKRHA